MKYTYSSARKYLYGLIPSGEYIFPGEIGIRRMELLLEKLDNPQDSYKTIHVAGTSGKGSTCYMIASICKAAGLKTGLHISPHIVSLQERMQVNGEMMSDTDFADLVFQARPTIDEVSQAIYGKVSYFEAVVALSFLHFKNRKVTIAVIETGLGGTYDATNIIKSHISVITPIGYDHTQILGNTLAEIAGNKAGIIKKSNTSVILAKQTDEAFEVIQSKAQEYDVPILSEGIDMKIEIKDISNKGVCFNYLNNQGRVELIDVECRLMGEHQAHNAALAITAVLQLSQRNNTQNSHAVKITEKNIREGLRNVFIPGRLEIVHSEGKTFLLDAAHNKDKIHALVLSLQKIWPDKKFTCIFTCKKGKDIDSMARLIAPVLNSLIITRFTMMTYGGKNLAMETKDIEHAFIKAGYSGKTTIIENSSKALEKAKNINNNDVILVTGSLFLVSEIRSLFVSF